MSKETISEDEYLKFFEGKTISRIKTFDNLGDITEILILFTNGGGLRLKSGYVGPSGETEIITERLDPDEALLK